MAKREKARDDRDYDLTQLHEAGHGRTLHRDYSGHFFRWSFARRFITAKDNVLEIGCGEDKPLSKILTGGAAAHVNRYFGVDLNKLNHYPINCDFDFNYGYTLMPDWANRSEEARNFAIRHYMNVVSDIHVTLIKK